MKILNTNHRNHAFIYEAKLYLNNHSFEDFLHMSELTGIPSLTLRAIVLDLVASGEVSYHESKPRFRTTSKFTLAPRDNGYARPALKRSRAIRR